MTVGSIEVSFLSLKTLMNTLFDLSYLNDPVQKARDIQAGVVFGQEEKREGPSGPVIQDQTVPVRGRAFVSVTLLQLVW